MNSVDGVVNAFTTTIMTKELKHVAYESGDCNCFMLNLLSVFLILSFVLICFEFACVLKILQRQ